MELIYIVPYKSNDKTRPSEILKKWAQNGGIYDLDSAKNEPGLLKSESPHTTGGEVCGGGLSPPNILLNIGGKVTSDFELWIAAVFGIMLQLAVIVYTVWIVMWARRNPRFQKEGYPPAIYAP